MVSRLLNYSRENRYTPTFRANATLHVQLLSWGGVRRLMFRGGANSESAKIMFHAPYRFLAVNPEISCSTRSETRDLQDFFVSVLGETDGEILYERTMSYCSNSSGWTLNADAAEIFGITHRAEVGIP